MRQQSCERTGHPAAGLEGWDPLGVCPRYSRIVWLGLGMLVLILQGPAFLDELKPAPDAGVDFFQEWASARNHWTGRAVYADQRLTAPVYLVPQRPEENHLPLRDVSLREVPPPPALNVRIQFNAHPPSSVLVALPFGRLNYPTATLAWNLCSLLCLAFSIAIVMREFSLRSGPWTIVAVVTVLLLSTPFRQQMSQGQLNLVLLLLLTLMWQQGRAGRTVSTGVLLGLATAFKLFPGFLFLMFLVRRDWQTVRVGLVSLLAVTSLTALVLGPATYFDYVWQVMPTLTQYRSDWLNASLPGLAAKLFNPSESMDRLVPLLESAWLARSLSACLCLAVLAAWWRQLRRHDDWDRQFNVSLIAMLLVSPVTWDHYFLLLLVPLAWCWLRLGDDSLKKLWFAGVFVALNLPLALVCDLLVPGGFHAGTAGPVHTLTILAYGTYGLVALWMLLQYNTANRSSSSVQLS